MPYPIGENTDFIFDLIATHYGQNLFIKNIPSGPRFVTKQIVKTR